MQPERAFRQKPGYLADSLAKLERSFRAGLPSEQMFRATFLWIEGE